jgi:hypothetical protein
MNQIYLDLSHNLDLLVCIAEERSLGIYLYKGEDPMPHLTRFRKLNGKKNRVTLIQNPPATQNKAATSYQAYFITVPSSDIFEAPMTS